MSVHNQLTFHLSIDRDQWLRYYAGHANAVRVLADSGKTLQLPANAFHSFISHTGVHGHFSVVFDQNHKLIGINRL